MRCGTKQFIVSFEKKGEGKKEEQIVYARTPADARKQLRVACGKETIIYTVKEK